jgi:hypothetical protein
MAKLSKQDAVDRIEALKAANRRRVNAFRARKRADQARKVAKAAKSIALQARKKAQLSADGKKRRRAKKRAAVIAANLTERQRKAVSHAELGCCDYTK